MKDKQPPKWASKFLKGFVSEELLEEIAGDLEEAYLHKLKSHGKFKADISYVFDVFQFFKPYSFEKYSRTKQYLPLFKNYFLIASRNIIKRKGFTAINLGGLTISLAVILLITLFVDYHTSYDQHYKDADRIYRFEYAYRSQVYAPFRFDEYYGADRNNQLKTISFLKSFSKIEEVCQMLQSDAAISRQFDYFIEVGDVKHVVDLVLFTNTPGSFQEMFPQSFIKGSKKLFTQDFNKMLITESEAERFFGPDWPEQEIIGQSIRMEAEDQKESNYTIAGIIKDPKPNSHFSFKVIVNTSRIPSWGAYTYFRTSEPIAAAKLQSLMNKRYIELEPEFGQDERHKGARIQKISDIHLAQGDMLYELRERMNPNVLTIFLSVAFVIFIITLTNYMNLSIAMYAHRQKEIGMRKVMGAQGKDIVLQLMTEIVLIAIIALPLAIYLVYLSLPLFNHIMDIEMQGSNLLNINVILGGLAITVITAILSGLYPSIIFSRKKPMSLFSARLNQSQGKYGLGLRRVLVGGQFVLLILMLSLSEYIYLQMDYINSKDLGFNKSGVVNVPVEGTKIYGVFKSKLEAIPEVEIVGSGVIPGLNPFNMTTYLLQGREEVFDDANLIYADYEGMRALGIDHPAFRELEDGKDRIHLINQTLADKLTKTYNISMAELNGQILVDEPEYTDPETGEVGISRLISGFLPDMHYFSLKFDINPLIFVIDRQNEYAFNAVIRLRLEDNYYEVLSKVEKAYYDAGNTRPFELSFLSDDIESLYKAERRTFWLIGALSVIAVLLAIGGLIGLVSFMVQTRQKEIGIRKVFGASVSQILVMVNREFIILMVLATIIAAPLVYILTGKWLENFAYRIDINPLIIILTGIGALLLVVLVVTIHSRKVAMTNPQDVLTEE